MKKIIFISIIFFIGMSVLAQPFPKIEVKGSHAGDLLLWHGQERTMRYQPQGTDFVILNGKRRFVRALYGTNTAFRVEAGDLPEFALYMPGMGGNFKFGIIAGDKSKWLIDAQTIKAIYRPGSMLYEIRDPILSNGTMLITVLALADAEGMIVKTEFKNITAHAELVAVFGGASGKKFSRDGDIGADPESSFYLQADNCKDNAYTIKANSFQLLYGSGKVLTEEDRYEIQHQPVTDKLASADLKNQKQLSGIFPSQIKITEATAQQSPEQLYNSNVLSAPVVATKMKIENKASYFLVMAGTSATTIDDNQLNKFFDKAEEARKTIAERIKINTPDKYINTMGGALSIAADAIWEDPTYMHGAVAWRMRLPGWRGPYVSDPLGWHDRARRHFSSYALSQITEPPVTGVVMDTALHLARHLEKVGTALFSDGYICRNPNGDIRAHHYDMNLVYIDALLEHFNWTGDTDYVRQMWPLMKRHLAWEKRNFDADGDGLYDAYAAIWASDALQYSGGGVTHSSAYNYRANKTAAEIATLIGEDGTMYKNEADKIYNAIQKNLWLPKQGSYAEYKDLLGNKLVHPSPALWTIYQAIDSKVPDPFQAYLNLRYVDNHIPHIPVKAKGFNENGLYLLSTTDWQPYTWSLNNVVLAENLNTALAYWQGNRSEEGFRLWRTAVIESMYMSASPGGFEQLSFYDAIRGELYRDFADPIGVAARSLVEGLFGIQPDALQDTLLIKPGLPTAWNYASIQTPDIKFDFKRNGTADNYVIRQSFSKNLSLKLIVNALTYNIASVKVNGVNVKWQIDQIAVGKPGITIYAPASAEYNIVIAWKGKLLVQPRIEYKITAQQKFKLQLPGTVMLEVYDPQYTLRSIKIKNDQLEAIGGDNLAAKTMFIKLKQGAFTWWQPIHLTLYPFIAGFWMDSGYSSIARTEQINLQSYFNDKVTNIFKHEYKSPRPTSPTLQLPTQGIGNWAYPLAIANIDDSGLRKMAGTNNSIQYRDEISFASPSDSTRNNIVFTSQWDNFPRSITIPLSGNAKEIYLLMSGSTNPMQSRIVNGLVVVNYSDGTADTLELENPYNWWPVEQDYYLDGYAFTAGWQIPDRLYLKEGKFGKEPAAYITIRGFSGRAIDGGAATVLNMHLDKNKTLQSLTIQTVANDVIIGLMAATLVRE